MKTTSKRLIATVFLTAPSVDAIAIASSKILILTKSLLDYSTEVLLQG